LPIIGLAAAALVAAAAFAETVTTENGYEIRRSKTVVPVPAKKVGRKTIDRETRTGVTEETDGNSSNFTMTLGGFMDRCPTPQGSAPVKFVVSGDFEYSIIANEVNTDVVPTVRRHYAKRMTARIRVFVNDDLSVTQGEIDGEFSADMDGVRTGPVRLHRSFPIRAFGTPDFDALLEAATVTGDMAAAALMWNASTTILESQLTWPKPNVCAEFEFEPPSETRTVASGETVEIRVKYRTVDGKQPIPKGTWDAAAEQGGRVPEASGQVKPDGTFVVRYVARTSSAPKEGDGARIKAISGAGFALDTWKIRVGADYELHFESTIISRDPMQAAQSRAHGKVRLTASTKPYKLKPDGKLYRLYDGTDQISFQTQSLRTDACDPLIQGAGKSMLKVEDTWIVITPPRQENGVQVPGKADVVLAYTFSMGGGETETSTAYEDWVCVPGKVHPLPFWWASYLSGRESEGDVNFLKNWQYVGQDGIVAKKTLHGSCGGMCDEEHSVFTLRKVTPP
jgi:hypothetical protein